MISAYIWDKSDHITVIALSHYRVECEQMLFSEDLPYINYFLVT